MLLAIDAGNTHLVFALIDEDGAKRSWRLQTDQRRTADDLALWLFNLLSMVGTQPNRINKAVLSCVVPQLTEALVSAVQKVTGQTVLEVSYRTPGLGIQFDISHPETMGADRIVNCVAAHRIYSGNAVIVDFGTATTFDVITEDGSYKGGAIAPGLWASMEALHMTTALLPRVDIVDPPQAMGTTTVGQIQSGLFFGYIGLFEGLVRRMAEELGTEKLRVIATGGLVRRFAEHSNYISDVDDDLTLKGLELVSKTAG